MKPNIDFVKQTLAKLGILDEASKSVLEMIEFSYSEGYQDAEEELAFNQEKVGVEFAKDAFEEVETLDEFREKYQEITNRSLNFMPTLGLK